MSEQSNGNGDSKKMHAIANSVTLQAIARIFMVTGMPVVTGLFCIIAWFASDLVAETRKTRDAFNTFQLNSSVALAHTDGRVTVLESRVGNLDGELFRLRDSIYRARPNLTPNPPPPSNP